MKAGLRRFTLAVHLTSSVGWIGAAAAFLALAITAVGARDGQLARSAYIAMPVLISYVIVPAACGALLTGLVSALGTQWGLFRHYWVLTKLLLTTFAFVVLLVQIAPIRRLAEGAADPASSIAHLHGAKRPLVHSVGGLLVLLAVQVLGVYKPRGETPFAPRRRDEL